MPWFPDFVTAAELARRQTRDPGQAVPAGRYLTSLSEGDTRHAAPERSRDHEHLRTEKAVTETEQKVAIITGGSQGIGAGLVDAYRQRGWAVVANSLSIKPSKDPDILTVQGDVSEQATADRIMSQALDRFGRVDTLVNNAGVFVSKPFTDYTAEDYALVTGVNLAGFFWLTQRAIGQMLKQYGGHVVNISASIAATRTPSSRPR